MLDEPLDILDICKLLHNNCNGNSKYIIRDFLPLDLLKQYIHELKDKIIKWSHLSSDNLEYDKAIFNLIQVTLTEAVYFLIDKLDKTKKEYQL